MKLRVRFGMEVSGKASDGADVERINAEIDSLHLRSTKRVVKLDESLMADLLAVLRDLGALMNRADARVRRRKR